MNTKLTLTLEEEVIKKAKAYAKNNGRSLSDLIENYLKLLTMNSINKNELTPKVKKLKGSIQLPDDFDAKQAYSDYLSKKHR